MSAPEVVVVLCTIPEAEASNLVDQLLDLRLVACAQLVGPIRSRYRWHGAVEEAAEVLLVLKTARDRVPALREAVLARHPHQVPEFVELPLAGGHEPYLQWVLQETRPQPSRGGPA